MYGDAASQFLPPPTTPVDHREALAPSLDEEPSEGVCRARAYAEQEVCELPICPKSRTIVYVDRDVGTIVYVDRDVAVQNVTPA